MPHGLLLNTPPCKVEAALRGLGANLRIARLRRNLALAEVAQKVGVSRELIAQVEHGKPTASAVVYAALLWTYGLVD